jgi:predicted nucleic acid-binding protein
MRLAGAGPGVARVWQLRDHATPYDAYLALAELLKTPLITADAVMAASAIGCEVELPAASR